MDTKITNIELFNYEHGMASVLITNLYYDTLCHQFVINNPNFRVYPKDIKWFGRDCPEEIGKDISCQNISETSHKFSFGTFKNNQKTVCLARRYSPHNYGHLLCETAIPIEYIYNLKNVNDISERVIIFDDDSLDKTSIFWFEGYNESIIEKCDTHSKNIFLPMASNVIFGLKKYINDCNFENIRYIQIENPIIHGIGGISPWCSYMWYQPVLSNTCFNILDRYVASTYKFYFSEFYMETQKQNTLTFIIKEGRRSVLNWKEVSVLLQNIANNNNLCYEQINLESVDYMKQLEILSRTKILVTNGGSSSFCSLLLQCSSSVVYFPLYDNQFESGLFKTFKHKFDFYDYEKYDTDWKLNIKTENFSYDVNICILKGILNNITNNLKIQHAI